MVNQSFKLNNGIVMPAIGLGTFSAAPNEVYNAVLEALKAGYRHIDTAYAYFNEKEIGQAIRDSGIPRSEIFVTTKLWNTFHRPEDVEKGFEKSLSNLGLDYIDLYLMHWPLAFAPGDNWLPRGEDGKMLIDDVDFTETWAAMEKLDKKKVRAIGVSNFNINKLEKLSKTQKIVPAVNQVELHPLLPQEELVKYCHDRNILMTAFSPLGSRRSTLHEHKVIKQIAEKYNVSTAQILISWGLHRNYSVIPKSVNASRIKTNFEIVDFEDKDFEALNRISKEEKTLRYGNPIDIWGIDIFDESN
ncbi:MAG: NADP-dependent oxidoreductase domain-containing protein [Benjaminiella poitrasii]|nr:MAG: NADP-dependent oxidoreductase domain-containing protein [Benjaminiella poitrasii]